MATPHSTDAPPSYDAAISDSTTRPDAPLRRVSTDAPVALTPRNGIPPEHRRSMEDEHRPLPEGWIRQFDPVEKHQFFVDTRANPPRSIWVHPYDDEEYLSTLSPEERRTHSRMHRTLTVADLAAESSDEEGGDEKRQYRYQSNANNSSHGAQGASSASASASASAAPGGAEADPQLHGLSKLTRRMKDRLTGTTHTQREASRAQRAASERQAYEAHLRAREALTRAIQTGQPQYLCKDVHGRAVYVEPPMGPMAPAGAVGWNPYAHGPYTDPNAVFVRPQGPYERPVGYGYGGGLGVPVAAGFIGGALLGGALLL